MILSTKQHEEVQFYLLMLFCFLLPLHPRLSVLTIIFISINWLLSGAIFKNVKALLNPLSLLFIGFYILHLIGLTYTSDMTEGWQKVETKLPLLLFPLILFSFPIKNKNQFNNILKSFVIGTFVATAYSFLHAFYNYSQDGLNWFYYKYLGGFLDFHPTYFSIYVSFALFIIFFFLIKKRKEYSKFQQVGFVTLLLWFFLFILLLSSRMTILVTSFIMMIGFLVFMFLQKKIILGLSIALIGIASLGFVAKNLPGLKKRTDKTIKRIESQQQKKGVSDIRMKLWSAAIEVIKKNRLLGTGVGDTQHELLKVYQERNFEKAFNENQNPHNQYLQTSVSLGIIGGLWLLMIMLVPFVLSMRHYDYLYILFLSLMLLSFLAESILQTQRGTLFFGFFNSLLAIHFLHFIKRKNHQSKTSL